MSFKLVKQVIRSEQQSPAHKLVLIVIADHTNETKSGTAWPAVETIGKYVGLKRRQVQRILRDLEESGQIEVVKRGAYKGTNRYRILSTWVSPTTPPDVSYKTPHSVTGDTSDVSYKTQRGVTHDTQVHKEQITTKAGGAPRSAQGATALDNNDQHGDSDAAGSGFAADAPKCETHTNIDTRCDTCYAYQVSMWRKEPV